MPHLMFPRLSRLEVRRYEPYVNGTADSFRHSFLPGVNVVVGINGLGKTTLLNIVFRMLVGPFDPAKAERDRPGRKQAGLVRNKSFDFFRKRANDRAVDAEATAVFHFGARTVALTRSLHDLRLVGWTLDGDEQTVGTDPAAADGELMDVMAELMGFDVDESKLRGSEAYRYDYDFVIRNLIFFLEDKVPLIWNPDGQFVILRILLLDQTLSDAISVARNDLLRADSQYRNRLWAANRLREQLEEELEAVRSFTVDGERYHLYASELSALESRIEDSKRERELYSAESERVENDLLHARAQLFDAQTSLRHEEAAYFHQAFKGIRAPGDLILQALGSHDGCLVCGSTLESAYERARQLMASHRCPVCETDTSSGSDGVVEIGDARLQRLKIAEYEAAVQRERLSKLEAEAEKLAAGYRRANEDLHGTTVLRDQARRRMDAAQGEAQRASGVRELEDRLSKVDLEVAELDAALRLAIDLHEDLVRRSQDFIYERSSEIVTEFGRYASAFMVEDCRLRFRRDRRAKVAQSDTAIDWPAFEVDLASGADSMPTERIGWYEVSESQKEFIDLAFRMALLRVASKGRASMLAVETPEASLDAFFVGKAGKLLRDYAKADPENVLLVTSNLTREEMIAQLLGTKDGVEDVRTRKLRTLNLLDHARPTKAYRQNQAFYDERFAEAIGDVASYEPDRKPVP